MFLPDGRVLIMDNEMFKKTIDNSIVLDMFDSTGNIAGGSGDSSTDESHPAASK